MNSQVESKLLENRQNGIGSLIAYYPVGYPNLEASIEAVVAISKAGADVIELGVPYSDPVMDGAVIQEATQISLENGFKLNQLFDALERITSQIETPVLVMSYWNPVLQYGVDRFAANLKNAGGAGLITPDLIPDEAAEWILAADKYDLDRVFLATPSSTDSRTSAACDESRGFVYAVSTMGITGAREEVDALARGVIGKIRKSNPDSLAAVGIGISTADQVHDVNSYADGAIVGSAIVKIYQQKGVQGLTDLIKELSEAAHKKFKENK